MADLASGPDKIDTEPLVADLAELTAGEPSDSFAVRVTECTGEGSFPPYVEATIENGHADLFRAKAVALGWDPAPADHFGDFTRGERVLSIDEVGDGVGLQIMANGRC